MTPSAGQPLSFHVHMRLKRLQEVKGIKSNVLNRYVNESPLQRRASAAGGIKIKHNVQPRREPAKTSPPSHWAVWVSSGDTVEISQQTSEEGQQCSSPLLSLSRQGCIKNTKPPHGTKVEHSSENPAERRAGCL